MPIEKLFGERCVRCGVTRTKSEFEGLPTCAKCRSEIKAKREKKHLCPACQCEMDKIIVLNILVDKCPECGGAWLDGGELDVLRRAIDAGRGDLATGLALGMVLG